MAGTGIKTKRRLLAVLIIFTALVILFIGRIGYIQIVQGSSLQQQAYEQQNRGRVINPKRGNIFDRNGQELAVSASAETITINPKDIKTSNMTLRQITDELSAILNIDRDSLYAKLTANQGYQIIKKKIDRDEGNKVRVWVSENRINGIFVDEDSKRYYPDRNLAAHVLGFTGIDNQGLDGIEFIMDKYLKGSPGRILSETDASGKEIPDKAEKRIEAQDGLNVVLTIDETIQYLASKVLDKAIADNNVKRGAVAIVMDPRNGDVLALVSKPDFDLNAPYAAPQGVDPTKWAGNTNEDVKVLQQTVWRDKAITDTYEPGSTFKAVTSAAGLEEGVVTPETVVSDSPVQLGVWTFKCWRYYKPHGTETFAEGVYNSCNPVFVRIAQALGVQKFYKYVRAFGFYDPTGIDLPGEVNGIIHSKPTEVDMAAASFGQRFTITPIQLITAYTAVANNGKLMKPRLIKEITDNKGNVVEKFDPKVIRNVISEKTSETLRQILEGVVSKGTGENAYIKGYRIAGKTGTSQTTEPGHYIASFVALAPADNPVICVSIMLDDPKGDSHMGGAIAAPVAGQLVDEILNYLHVEKQYTEEDKKTMLPMVDVPEIRKLDLDEAVKSLKEKRLQYVIENSGNKDGKIVVEQTPKPGAKVNNKSVVILYTYTPEQQKKVAVPDILNDTAEEAMNILAKCGLNIYISGMGNVVKQQYEPGTLVNEGSTVEVELLYLDNIE